MAIEVSWRILRATPVNATGLVSALLLTTRGTALTLDQLHHTLQDSLDYLERKQTPMTNSALRLRTADGVRAALDALSNGHPVTCVDGGREPVWRIAPEQEHEAAFYRNTIIDAFLETAIVEMALAYAARADGDRLEAFWSQAMRLRDLLKFDFYFADSAAFREHIAEEMAWNGDWEAHVAAGGEEIDAILRAKRPLIAQAVLRPYFEAYEIVADVLRDAPAEIDEKELTKKALGVGNQYVAQNRVRSTEAVSALLFATARQVAADQHLLEPAADLVERRTAFRDELRDVLRDMDKVEQISREQFYVREMRATPPARRGRVARRAAAIRWIHDHRGVRRAQSRRVAGAVRGCAAGRRYRGRPRRVDAGRRADRDGTARSGPDHHLRPAVRQGRGRDRGRGGRRVVHVRRVPGAAPATGVLDADGYRALRIGTLASAIWTVCAALLVPLTVSDVTGQPLTARLSPSDIWSVAGLVETAGRVAVDGVSGGDRDRREHSGAAVVADAAAVRRVAGHADSACAHRAFVVGRLA